MWLYQFTLICILGLTFATALYAPRIPAAFCDGRASGAYGLGCSHYYVNCENGLAKPRRCGGSLYFDESASTCMPKAQCGACAVGLQQPILGRFSPVSPDVFTCLGKDDGVYKQQCSGLFIVCNNYEATFLTCPHGLIYDGLTAKCQQRVRGCMKKSSLVSSTLSVKQVAAFSCKSVNNGFYRQSGFDYVIKCMNGRSTLFNCPEGLYLNPQNSLCVNAAARRGKRFLTGGASALGGDELVLYNDIIDVALQPVLSLVSPVAYYPTCVGLPFGVSVSGCSSDYVVALPNYCSVFHCPRGQVFDISLKKCTAATEVSSCKTKPPKQPVTPDVVPPKPVTVAPPVPVTTVLPASVPVIPPQPVTPAVVPPRPVTVAVPVPVTTAPPATIVTTPAPTTSTMLVKVEVPTTTALPKFDCTGKIDGPYCTGCTDTFTVCVNGIANTFKCAPGLKYDTISSRCLEEIYVKECGGSPTPIPIIVTAPPVTATPVMTPPPTKAPESPCGKPECPLAEPPVTAAPIMTPPPTKAPESPCGKPECPLAGPPVTAAPVMTHPPTKAHESPCGNPKCPVAAPVEKQHDHSKSHGSKAENPVPEVGRKPCNCE